MKLTFNTRYEQLEYEIDSLVKTSGDPQFTGYLKGLIYDARNNPSPDYDYLSLQLAFYLASWGM